MGLIYDNPDLAALTLTRLAAKQSEGPGPLEGRMLAYLGNLEDRNGTEYLEVVAITLSARTSSLLRSWHGQPGPTLWRFSTPRKWRLWRDLGSGGHIWCSVGNTGTIEAPTAVKTASASKEIPTRKPAKP
jgi:hypothetical protein